MIGLGREGGCRCACSFVQSSVGLEGFVGVLGVCSWGSVDGRVFLEVGEAFRGWGFFGLRV